MENNSATTATAHRHVMDFDLSATAAVAMSLVSAALFFLLMYFYYSCHCSEKRRMLRSRPPELPVVAYRKAREPSSSPDGCCAICLGDLEEGEELKAIPGCGHAFHPPCIDRWVTGHRSCPVCRCTELSGQKKDAAAAVSAAEGSVVEVAEEESG